MSFSIVCDSERILSWRNIVAGFADQGRDSKLEPLLRKLHILFKGVATTH